MRPLFTAGVAAAILLNVAQAQPAALDPTFGTDGRATVQVGSSSFEIGHAVALLADGRAVVAGETTDADGEPALALVRVLPDGRPDPTFGRDGRLAFSAGGTFRAVADLAVQADGRLVVAGTALSPDRSELRAVVMRFTAGGLPDAGFGDGGVVTLYEAYGGATALALDAAGRIVVAGTAVAGDNTSDLRIARLLPGGARDATFGDSGLAALSFGPNTIESLDALALDAAGRIVAAGTASQPASGGSDMVVVRLTADGAPDAAFGTDGRAQAGWGEFVYASGNAMQIDAAGRVVVAGSRGDDVAVARFTAAGALDAAFGTGGRAAFPGAGTWARAHAVALDAAGRIVLAGGETTHTVGEDIAVLRLTPAGALDTAFGAAGRTALDLDSAFDYGYALALRPDGRPLVVGGTQQPSANGNGRQFDVALVQLAPTGALDPAFGHGGVALVGGVGPGPSAAVAVLPLADGRTVVAARAERNNEAHLAAVRLLADGTPDPSFGADGRATVAFDGPTYAQVAALQADGAVVVGGTLYAQDEAPSRFAAARFRPDGTLDPAFGDGGRATVAFPESVHLAGAQALADGRTLLVGTLGDDLALARLLPDGTLDASFGTGGRRVVAVGAELRAVALAVDGAGRLVVAAERFDVSPSPMVAVRLLPDGSPDASFGAGGVASVAFGSDAEVAALTVRPDGRVVLAGRAGQEEARRVAVAQLTPGGALDAAFGDDGRVRLDVGPYGRAEAVALDADGRLVLAGSRDGDAGQETIVARLTASGQPDPAFGDAGLARVDGAATYVRALALDGRGRPLVAGATFGTGPEALTVLRLLPDAVVAGEPAAAPAAFALSASPNPSRGDARVTLRLDAPSAVRVEVLDALGRRVAQLHDGLLAAGPHTFALGGARLQAGVYVVRAAAPGGTVALPVVVAR